MANFTSRRSTLSGATTGMNRNCAQAIGQKLADLPGSGGGHSTRTILFANGKMYVAVGSSCNVCKEDDKRRAAVTEYNEDGSGRTHFSPPDCGMRSGWRSIPKPTPSGPPTTAATGWATICRPKKSMIWAPNGGNFGWPYCYGDRVPDRSQSKDYDCSKTIAPKVRCRRTQRRWDCCFTTAICFRLNIAEACSSRFTDPGTAACPPDTKWFAYKFNDKGEPQGPPEDFITGWIRPGETKKGVWMGRPVGLVVGPDGAMYVSDDSAGVVYRVTWGK